MDKRFHPIPLNAQVQQRQALYDTLASHPEWPFAQILRHLRTSLHLTQAEMALLCQVATQTIVKTENGQSSPTLDTVHKILRPFGLQWRITQRDS